MSITQNVTLASQGSQDPIPATDFKLPGSDERLFSSNGEFNAGSQKELLSQQKVLLESSTRVATEDEVNNHQREVASRKKALLAAINSDDEAENLGTVLAENLQLTANRAGFARRFMVKGEVAQGQEPKAEIEQRNVTAVSATSATQLALQVVRNNVVYPPEFYIRAAPFVELKSIMTSSTDILGTKFMEALEATMVTEDRTWLSLAKRTAGISNPFQNIVGRTTPEDLSSLANTVDRWSIPPKHWLLASDVWTDLISLDSWSHLIDPVTKLELFNTGTLGTILGMTAVTDQFRHPSHKVLQAGEQVVVGAPELHGQFTDRGGVDSVVIDESHEGVPGKGWRFTQLTSMVIFNANSVSVAQRTL